TGVASTEMHSAGWAVEPLFDPNEVITPLVSIERYGPVSVIESARRPTTGLLFQPRHKRFAVQLIGIGSVPTGHVKTSIQTDERQAGQGPSCSERRIACAGGILQVEIRRESRPAWGCRNRYEQGRGSRADIDVDRIARRQIAR